MTASDAPYGVTHLIKQAETPATWWSGYASALRTAGISPTSLRVIEADADFIVSQGILGAGPTGSDEWPASRERSGVVMGAVQSGKTASMLAVVAKALDEGVDAVVVLGGTRTALWRQTFARLTAQLDTSPDPWQRRVLVPNRSLFGPGSHFQDLSTLYAVTGPLARRSVANRIPIVGVVMKNVHHLERMADTLHRHIYPAAAKRAEPFHLLVIDDEADDSSILDAVSEARAGVSLAETKQVPRRIADLWERRTKPGTTAQTNLFATYIAYTATPQANFLQDWSNPLAPRDFVVSLRTPSGTGDVERRTTSYTEPAGLGAWYTGGEIFYRTLDGIPLCRTDDQDEDVLGNALRCFLIGSAVRLWRAAALLGPATAAGQVFETAEAAKQAIAPVASMLVHPSSAKEDHFDDAARVLAWSDGSDPAAARERLNMGERSLSVEGIRAQLDEDVDSWLYWIDDFARAADRLFEVLSLPQRPIVPTLSDWPEIRRLILDEVVPGTRVAVINSDEAADDRPNFEPLETAAGWVAPPNHSTIFVSGNVMARGLTLEGLTSTLFMRQSDAPLADTQMQMQRWFGYRGKVLELCRVFLAPRQLELFRAYHEADEALRRDIMAVMDEPNGPSCAVTVLQGHDFSATGKIANVVGSEIWPGPTPFVRYINHPKDDESNAAMVAGLFAGASDVVATKNGRPLGVILDHDLTLLEAADLLDRLAYSTEGQVAASPDAMRWVSLGHHLGLKESSHQGILFRAPDKLPVPLLGKASPHFIAAYLRAWSACLSRSAPGLSTTDPPYGPWSLVDLTRREAQQPVFRVGLRFGGGVSITQGPISSLTHGVTTMERAVSLDRVLESTWGSRGSASKVSNEPLASDRYPGDEYFDYFARGERRPDPVAWGSARPPGEPGLILFHPIHPVMQGNHEPLGAEEFSLAVGVSIPLGGPDQVVAMVTERTGD